MAIKTRKFIPALNRRWLTPLYDPVMRYLMREQYFKRRLVNLADPRAGELILDLGCGTGTLTEMLKRRQPSATVVGIDVDPAVLRIAGNKISRDPVVRISLARGFTVNLPFPDNTFDMVVSSLVIHHLNYEDKLNTFREAARILAHGGRLCIADFGTPHDGLMRLVVLWMKYMEKVADNFNGAIPGLLREAGFKSIEESVYVRTVFGPMDFYRAFPQK